MSIYNKHPIEKLSDEQDNSLDSIQGELEYLHKDVNLDCPDCGEPLQKSYTKAANGMELDVEYDMLYCETDDTNIYQHDVRYNSIGGNGGGGYTEAQINHLLSKKQNIINEDNKLSADLIDDDNTTNKFTNTTEKQTWNAKQDTIDTTHKLSADLVDDTDSTNKFTNATEKQTWSGKQNAIDSTHQLDADLVDDTSSTNKFTNATEKQTWNAKQDALAVGTNLDDTPVENSTNPITSGGVYAVVGNINTVLEEVL